uniref:Uncharacterized protein n=1 Tax=Rhizophora mucronata TaxID=61149 RepID=A0A2P2PHE6_RHIMU
MCQLNQKKMQFSGLVQVSIDRIHLSDGNSHCHRVFNVTQEMRAAMFKALEGHRKYLAKLGKIIEHLKLMLG